MEHGPDIVRACDLLEEVLGVFYRQLLVGHLEIYDIYAVSDRAWEKSAAFYHVGELDAFYGPEGPSLIGYDALPDLLEGRLGGYVGGLGLGLAPCIGLAVGVTLGSRLGSGPS
jgi:hypothetical protein